VDQLSCDTLHDRRYTRGLTRHIASNMIDDVMGLYLILVQTYRLFLLLVAFVITRHRTLLMSIPYQDFIHVRS